MTYFLKVTNFFQSRNFIILTCLLIVLLPNARFFFKYLSFLPGLFFCFYIFFIVKIRSFLINNEISNSLKKFFTNPIIITLIFFLILILVSFIYPIADGLKEQMRGSDQDDCVILGVTFLSKLANPYSQPSYFGNMCSTGLGMIILYFPFVISGFYPLGTITSVIFSVFSIDLFTKEKYRSLIYSFLLISSLICIELLVVGSDLVFIGAGIVTIVYCLTNFLKTKNISKLIFLSIFAGLIASSRINFLILIPLLFLFVFNHWKKGAFVFLSVSLSIAFIPSAFIYFSDPQQFMPFHLIGKSDLILKNGLKEMAILFTIFMILVSYKISKKNIDNIPLCTLLSITPSLLCLSIGDLIFFRSLNIATWEGANYLMPIIPLAASFISKDLLSYAEKE